MDIEDVKLHLISHEQPKVLKSEIIKDKYLGKYSKVFIKSYGCPHNYSDGEYMAGN